MPDTKPDRCGEWCCAEKVAGILALDPVAMTYHVEVSFPEALAAWERLGEYNEWNTERAERLLRGIAAYPGYGLRARSPAVRPAHWQGVSRVLRQFRATAVRTRWLQGARS